MLSPPQIIYRQLSTWRCAGAPHDNWCWSRCCFAWQLSLAPVLGSYGAFLLPLHQQANDNFLYCLLIPLRQPTSDSSLGTLRCPSPTFPSTGVLGLTEGPRTALAFCQSSTEGASKAHLAHCPMAVRSLPPFSLLHRQPKGSAGCYGSVALFPLQREVGEEQLYPLVYRACTKNANLIAQN